MKSVVSEKGQVTLPKKLRERLGIYPGQVIDWDEDDGRLVGIKVRDDYDDVLRSLTGTLELGMTTDELMEILRGPRDLT